MNLKPKLKKIFSGTLSFTVLSTLLLDFPVKADDINEKYPYIMFAASDTEGAITINANNFYSNGNIATNGTIVSSGNVRVNGTRTENANEEMLYIQKKLNYSYFSGNDVDLKEYPDFYDALKNADERYDYYDQLSKNHLIFDDIEKTVWIQWYNKKATYNKEAA